MFLILKVVLIILLNETYAYITQDSEIILLPAWNPIGVTEIPLTLKVFGKQIQLNLRRNDQIMSAFKVWKHNVKIITEKLSQLNAPDSCYYSHEDHISTAVINFCQEHGLEGIIFLGNTTLDISPLQNNFAISSSIGNFCVETETNVSFGKPHLIKHLPDSDLFHVNKSKPRQRRSQNDTSVTPRLKLELAVFLDETAYYRLLPLHDKNKTKIRNMLLAYVNGLEAVLQHPSLGVSINILLRHMEIMEIQPADLPHHGGHASSLWYSFCNYAYRSLHASEKYHWDVALYLTGLNLYNDMNYEHHGYTAVNTTHTRGWARKNNLCTLFSCAIVEFGAQDYKYPISTTGFGSIYSAAQQLGLLFGMTSERSKCSEGDNIMSFFYEHELHRTVWSSCSREIAMELWRTKRCLLDGRPEDISYQYRNISSTGESIATVYDNDNHDYKSEGTAKKQCELFLRDKEANVVTLDNVCKFLQCEVPDKTSSSTKFIYLNHEYEFHYNNYFAGPALDGTHCAPRKECHYGTCSLVESTKILNYREDGNWGEWKEESCKKNCLEESKGVIIRRRICRDMNDRPAICEGPSYDVQLCDDSSLCSEKPRLPIKEYMNKYCKLVGFSAVGMQAAYDSDDLSAACTIFCLKKTDDETITYYAPIKELLDPIRSFPYLPDGTLCYTDYENGEKFFCRKHQCKPYDRF